MGHPAYGVVREATSFASVLLENNPSILTLEGTNTWILRAPNVSEASEASEASDCVVVDPGHDDLSHLELVAQSAPISLILLTHHHPDHADGAFWLADRVNAPVRAFDPMRCRSAESLVDGEELSAGGLRIKVLHTPGHTEDSVTFVVEHAGETAVLTGDTVLGRGTTGINDLAQYFASLRKLLAIADSAAGSLVGLPGHGPELFDLKLTLQQYLAHRERRLEQVRDTIQMLGEDATARQVVELVYVDVDQALWPAAEYNVMVQLRYLRD